ncbi:unnamed protein product [Orchesella dallaii]|uniref:Uncharacterized protein n=1 Tax=Orchesella dallaii TaxID=48710 RepID=A0ABP1QZX8_9HEXA
MGTTTTEVEIDNKPSSPPNDDSTQRKIHIYSGQDFAIAALLHILNIFEPHVIEYAAALLIELDKNPDTGEFLIESPTGVHCRRRGRSPLCCTVAIGFRANETPTPMTAPLLGRASGHTGFRLMRSAASAVPLTGRASHASKVR